MSASDAAIFAVGLLTSITYMGWAGYAFYKRRLFLTCGATLAACLSLRTTLLYLAATPSWEALLTRVVATMIASSFAWSFVAVQHPGRPDRWSP